MAEPAAGLPSLSVDGDEVRVKTAGRIRDYVSYVVDRLRSETGASTSRVVTVTATGRAVPKAVAVAEIAKRSHGGALHQVTTIDSLEAADGARRRKSDAEGAADEGTRVGEPTANEKEKETNTRRVTAIAVALSRDARALDAEAPGYQFSPETTFTPTLPSSPSAARSDRRRSDRRKDDRAHEPEKKKKNAEDAAATPDGKADAPKVRRRARRGRGGAKKEKEKAADDADA